MLASVMSQTKAIPPRGVGHEKQTERMLLQLLLLKSYAALEGKFQHTLRLYFPNLLSIHLTGAQIPKP